MEKSIQAIVRFVCNNWLNLISVSIALISFISYLKARKSKKPSFSIYSNNIIQDFTSHLDELNIKYKNNDISNLTITKVSFWNGGKKTIDKNDVAKANPIRVESKGKTKILDAKIIYIKNSANQISIDL